MINTVTGPIAGDQLGITLMHEHIVFGYPGYAGDVTLAPFDRKAAVDKTVALLTDLKALGLHTFVDATPNETGRDPELYREISERSGVQIICATGYYSQAKGGSAYFTRRAYLNDQVVEEIYDMFMTEITQGIAGTGIRPGVIKVATGEGTISDYERNFLQAAARAQKETGTPIITHTEMGSMGPEQAQMLISFGADPSQIMIGHMCDNLDLAYQEEVLAQGVYVAWDRMGLQKIAGCPMDAERFPVLLELITRGYADRLMLSHDYIVNILGRPLPMPDRALPLVENWHPSYLFTKILPTLADAGVDQAALDAITQDNPRRLFTGGYE